MLPRKFDNFRSYCGTRSGILEAKIEAISDFSLHSGKRQLMRFLGRAGYYRKFCNSFSIIAVPLTNLLGKRFKFISIDDCQKYFEKLKVILKNDPHLLAPSFDKEFKLAIDASDVGAGSVLLQEDDNGVDNPVVAILKSLTNIREITLPYRKNAYLSSLLFSTPKFTWPHWLGTE